MACRIGTRRNDSDFFLASSKKLEEINDAFRANIFTDVPTEFDRIRDSILLFFFDGPPVLVPIDDRTKFVRIRVRIFVRVILGHIGFEGFPDFLFV